MSFPAMHTSYRKMAGFLVAGLLLTGCFVSDPSSSGKNGVEGDVALKMRMGIGSVTALGKTSTITLNKMVVVLTSSANDTIRDTIVSPTLNTVSTTGQTVAKNYTLKALRSWKVNVKTLDLQNFIIHRDSTTIPAMYAGDTAVVNLNMSSKYSMYEAKFLTLPTNIRSSADTTVLQPLHISRLVLKIDGVTVRDSIASPGPYFTAGGTHTLAYDYVATGTRVVQMIAYGPMGNWPADSALFRGSTTVNTNAGVDSTATITLGWVGPTTGTGSISVALGRVGKITVNGTLPGTISIP